MEKLPCSLPDRAPRRYRPLLSALAAALALAACSGDRPQSGDEHLAVVVRVTPAAWHWQNDKAQGVDHDLLARLAESLGVKLKIHYAINTSAAFNALCKPHAQLAVGLLTPTAQNEFRVGPRYDTLRQQLLYRFDQPRPASTADLVMENVEVGTEPAHLDTLLDIKQRNADLTRWVLHADLAPHKLIELVDRGLAGYTIADSHAVTMTRRFYPRIQEAFDLGNELPVHWVFGDCANAQLVASVEKFFAAAAADRTLAQILDRYYGHATQLDYPEKLTFIKNVDRHLERYRNLFVKAADETGIDWKLLAAVSYQESHWNPQARSPSGVEGLMMLTRETAEQFGIADRKDPAQSIGAGARFLLKLKQWLPPDLDEPDRSWFALAAYNSGFKYVEKAMTAAHAKGLSPLLWINIRDFLQKPRRTGPAALNNPFTYVYNVRAYHDTLAWLEGALSFDVRDEASQKPVLPTGPAPI